MDMINKINMSYEDLYKLLKYLREIVRFEGKKYCKEFRILVFEFMMIIKFEGFFLIFLCVSLGIYYLYFNYYIWRVRIFVFDLLYKMIEKLKCYFIYNENG